MMFVLDTNVFSQMMSANPAQRVADGIVAQPWEALFTAAVCQAEILSGIARMPQGHRHAELEKAAGATSAGDFRERVLAFDTHAARCPMIGAVLTCVAPVS